MSRQQACVIEPRPDEVFISISDTENSPFYGYTRYPKTDGWKWCVELEFDDVLSDNRSRGFKAFTEEQAQCILGAVRKGHRLPVTVHCNAGISRSVAVAVFLRDFLGYSVDLCAADDESLMNLHVYRSLGACFSRFYKALPLKDL